MGGSSAVTNVFGRTGTVTPQTGDYSFSQILGSAAIAQGGTGATTAAGARTNLGVATSVHTHALTDLAGITGKYGNASTLLSFGGGVPAGGDCAQFDSGGNVVGSGAPCGTGSSTSISPNYAVTFSAESSKSVTAGEHGFHTANLLGTCYDTTASPWAEVDGYSMTVNPSTYEVALTFPVAFTGACVINAGGAGTSSGGGAGTGTAGGDAAGALDALTVVKIQNRTVAAVAPTDGQLLGWSGANSRWQPMTVTSGGGGSGDSVTAGAGIVMSGTAPKTVAVDTSVIPTYLRGTFSTDISAIANGTCAQRSFSMPGAATAMTGLVAVNASFPTGVNLQLAKVPSPGNVIIELCNQSGGSYTPAAGLIYTVTLIGAF